MISVDEANRFISSYTREFSVEKISFLQSNQRILAEPIIADTDLPPYHRVMMDGIALNSDSFTKGQRKFTIESMAAAGSPVQSLHDTGYCIEVMTGAVLPINTDAVIPYEQLSIHDKIAEVKTEMITPFQNVHKQATDANTGDVLIPKHVRITPAHISVMATVGKFETKVYQLPSVAVCSTGDELIEVSQPLLPHQVRQSNVYFILADLEKENIRTSLYHLPDDKEEMQALLQIILQKHDVVLLSGAVSKGKKDYLPQSLTSLGMQTIFHNVAQRPGKPFLFGNLQSKLVFGFPGNPVSTFVCYHLYCKRWLLQCLHQITKQITAKLLADVKNVSSLTLHILVKLRYEEGCCFAEPIGLSSSGDIPALINAEGIISLPAEKKEAKKGEVFKVILCR